MHHWCKNLSFFCSHVTVTLTDLLTITVILSLDSVPVSWTIKVPSVTVAFMDSMASLTVPCACVQWRVPTHRAATAREPVAVPILMDSVIVR